MSVQMDIIISLIIRVLLLMFLIIISVSPSDIFPILLWLKYIIKSSRLFLHVIGMKGLILKGKSYSIVCTFLGQIISYGFFLKCVPGCECTS